MARLTKDGSLRGQKPGVELVSKAPTKILVIPANDLVQVIAKVCSFSCFCSVLGKLDNFFSYKSFILWIFLSMMFSVLP